MAAYTTIDNPELYFQAKLFTGTGSSNAITLDGDEDMQPDLLWIKERGNTSNHRLHNSVSGATKYLESNSTEAESTDSNQVSSFNSDGFTVGSANATNRSSGNFVAWCWKESATAGFDIVAYTGNGSAQNISHSLSAVPKMIILKERVGTENWMVYHAANTSAPETDYLLLNTTSATADYPVWNDTAPTSSVFSIGTDSSTSTNTDTYITYLFAEKQGFSKFGSYTGNGNANGPFVYTGFRPALIILKRTDTAKNWYFTDAKRKGYNNDNPYISPNLNVAETGGTEVDLLSNGFRITASGTGHNQSGGTYLYVAFAEAPFVNSNGVPCNAR